MDPRISRFDEIKAEIRTITTQITSNIARAWGHILQVFTPEQRAEPTIAKTQNTYHTVIEEKQPEAPATKALPKTPAEIKQAKVHVALLEGKLKIAERKKTELKHELHEHTRDPFILRNELSQVFSEIEALNKELKPLKSMLSAQVTIKKVPEASISRILEELNDVSQTADLGDFDLDAAFADFGFEEEPVSEISKPTHAESKTRVEFEKLKTMIASINDDQKLKTRSKGFKIGEQTPLEAKIIQHTIGHETPKALNEVLNRLASFAKSETISYHDILEVIYTFETQDWTQKALENPTIKEKMHILTQYLHTKMSYDILSESHDHLENRVSLFEGDKMFRSNFEASAKKVEELREQLLVLNDAINNSTIFPN